MKAFVTYLKKESPAMQLPSGSTGWIELPNGQRWKAEFVEDRKQFENKYLRNEGYAVEVPELYAAIDESAVTIGKVSEPVEG